MSGWMDSPGMAAIGDDLQRRNSELRRIRLAAAREKGRHTKEQWLGVLAEVAGECVRCGGNFHRLDKDHVVPIYQGGSDGLDNLQPLCARCNAQKGPETINWLKQWRGRRRGA